LGGKREKKNKAENKGNEISRFAPAFGRAETPSTWLFLARVNACPSIGSLHPIHRK
jgi:hypothetical protein